MKDFILTFQEPTSYLTRNKNSTIINLLFGLGIFVLITITSNWKYGSIISIVFLVIQYYKSSRWDKCFITEIIFNNDNVNIKYIETNQVIELIGHQTEFRFIKRIAFNSTKTLYLAVYFKNELLIKQFVIGEWNENIFDDVIKAFS